MTRNIVAWAVACLALCALPAAAQDCKKPLKLLTSLPMAPLGQSGVLTIPVTINGVAKQFLFDTGGSFPQVSPAVVDELMLPRYESTMRVYAVNGAYSDKYTKIDKFVIGNFPAVHAVLQISPITGMDGLFSPVIFKGFDFDIDFAGRKLNIVSSDHCDGQVIYWPAKAFAVVPITVNNFQITVPVTVDGHNLMAIIDTGASTSIMRLDVARTKFDLTPDSPDMKSISHVDGDEKAMIYSYPFKTLSFGGVTVNNPKIRIFTDIMNKNADHTKQTGSLVKSDADNLTLSEVTIGMDVLSHLHLYLAQQEHKLYLTEASSPENTPPPAP